MFIPEKQDLSAILCLTHVKYYCKLDGIRLQSNPQKVVLRLLVIATYGRVTVC